MSAETWADAIAREVAGMVKKTEGSEGVGEHGTLLSTGSTLLNLALSGRASGGLIPGKYYYFVGDSSSGKTWFTLSILAEAAKNEAFKDHRLIYDAVEGGALMDVGRFFGSALEDRLEPPALDSKGEELPSSTIEDFYFNLDDKLGEEKPFIYILDSMDGLSSDDEAKNFAERKKAYRKGSKMPGSYGDGKAKKNSENIRTVVRRLKQTGSILVVISQTRDLLNAGPFQETKTRAGGRALRFYATTEIWTSLGKSIKKEVNGKTRKIGANVTLKIKKNRITGKESTVSVALYPSFGLDDTGTCVDFLVEEKHWKKSGGTIQAGKLGNLTREKLIQAIESGKGKLLRKEVARCWRGIEDATAIARKPRYE